MGHSARVSLCATVMVSASLEASFRSRSRGTVRFFLVPRLISKFYRSSRHCHILAVSVSISGRDAASHPTSDLGGRPLICLTMLFST